jgi:hypothetical protein
MSDNCIIIGDIKGSRSIDSWPNFFKKLDGTLRDVNKKFVDHILVDFRPTAGDEFQGALIDPKKAYAIYIFIKSRLPVEIYYGIGIGDVERPLAKDIVSMRGSAFYRARSAVELCKKKKRNILIKSSDTTNQIDEVINTVLNFIEVLENSRTKRQQEIVNYYRPNQRRTYEQLGKKFGISKQSVSQILDAANWDAISQGETVVNRLMEIVGEKMDVKGIGFTNENKANMLYQSRK